MAAVETAYGLGEWAGRRSADDTPAPARYLLGKKGGPDLMVSWPQSARSSKRARFRTLCREREECQRAVSALMDDAPEWRDWFARQLELLDLEYDPHHWITMEWIR